MRLQKKIYLTAGLILAVNHAFSDEDHSMTSPVPVISSRAKAAQKNIEDLVPAKERSLLSISEDFITGMVEAAEKSKEQGGKVSPEIRKKLDELSAYVDVEALAKKSLGNRWGKLPKSQRSEFIDTLSDILEEIVYPKAVNISARADEFVYKVDEKNKNYVLITGFIEREKLGEIISNPFTMRLEFNQKTKKIVDAYVEDELISANLKRQFDRALEKRNFAEIIKLMKKRVAKARQEKSSKASNTAGAR